MDIDWCAIDMEGMNGYFLEVGLDYPPSIHDATTDLPFAPFNQKVEYDMMTDFMRNEYEMLNIGGAGKYRAESKLLLTQEPKKNYKKHFKFLQYFLQQGMKITKVHR